LPPPGRPGGRAALRPGRRVPVADGGSAQTRPGAAGPATAAGRARRLRWPRSGRAATLSARILLPRRRMSALICGSLAYDTIMVFPDQFKNHILPDKVHILNVSFLVPRMRREFGGCAGNIAYNLKLLGGDPI